LYYTKKRKLLYVNVTENVILFTILFFYFYVYYLYLYLFYSSFIQILSVYLQIIIQKEKERQIQRQILISSVFLGSDSKSLNSSLFEF